MDNFVFGLDTATDIYAIINLVVTVIGYLASLLIILIIYRMKSQSGHLVLLLYMTYFQLAYDMFCFSANVNCGYYWTVMSFVDHVISGIAVSMISNWMTFVAVYLILFKKPFDAYHYRTMILFTSVAPGIIDGICYLIYSVPESQRNDALGQVALVDACDNLRLALIVLDFFLMIFVLLSLHNAKQALKKLSHTSTTHTSATAPVTIQSTAVEEMSEEDLIAKEEQFHAMQTLAVRIIFYPLIQAPTRISYAYYESKYGIYRTTENLSFDKYFSLLLLSISTPLVSIGYLFLFLVLQPTAWEHCKAIVGGHYYPVPDTSSTMVCTGRYKGLSGGGAGTQETTIKQKLPSTTAANNIIQPVDEESSGVDDKNDRVHLFHFPSSSSSPDSNNRNIHATYCGCSWMDTWYQTLYDKRSDEELFDIVSTIYDLMNNKTRSRRGSYYLGNQQQAMSYFLEEGHHDGDGGGSVSIPSEMLHISHSITPRHHLIPTIDTSRDNIEDNIHHHPEDDENDSSSDDEDDSDTDDIREVVENILLQNQIEAAAHRKDYEKRLQQQRASNNKKGKNQQSRKRSDKKSSKSNLSISTTPVTQYSSSERYQDDSSCFESSNTTTSSSSLSTMSTKFTRFTK